MPTRQDRSQKENHPFGSGDPWYAFAACVFLFVLYVLLFFFLLSHAKIPVHSILSVRPSIHASKHPSIHPCIHPCIHAFIYFIYSSILSFIRSFVRACLVSLLASSSLQSSCPPSLPLFLQALVISNLIGNIMCSLFILILNFIKLIFTIILVVSMFVIAIEGTLTPLEALDPLEGTCRVQLKANTIYQECVVIHAWDISFRS